MLFEKKKSEFIVDVHSHILPGIDDGARDIAETIKMLLLAEAEGITHIVATPHFKKGYHNAAPQKVKSLLQKIQNESDKRGISITLFPGNELYYFSEIEEELDQGIVCTMNESEFLLVEFSPLDSYRYIRNGLSSIQSAGLVPILAHIERYECLQREPGYARELKDMGIKIQINTSSVTGKTEMGIKRFTHGLLKKRLVDYIGTDAHRSGSRAPRFRECSRVLYKKYDSSYVDAILYENAMDDFLRNQI